jgi:hypothetical protein
MKIQDEGLPPDPGGFSPVTDEELKAAIEAEDGGEEEGKEAEPDKPSPAGKTPAEAPAPAAAAPESIELGGKKYTRTELEELVTKGPLRLDDYSREKNRLAERERALQEREERLEALGRQRQPAAGEEEEELDPNDPAALRARLETLERREQERELNAFAERADAAYEKTFDALCTKHGVTDPKLRELYDRIIVGHNPKVKDLKRLGEEITRIFEEAHGVLGNLSKAAVETKLAELKKSVRPPSPKGGGAVPVTPGAKPKRSFDDPVTAEELAEAQGG